MKKAILDSSVLFSLNKDMLGKLVRQNNFQIWDTPVGLFELMTHAIKTTEIKNKDKWAQSRCEFLKQLSGNRILPSPETMLKRELDKFFHRAANDRELSEEQKLFWGIRNAVAEKRLSLMNNRIIEVSQFIAKTSEDFCKEIDKCMITANSNLNTKNPEEIEETCVSIQGMSPWQKELTEILLKTLNISNNDIAKLHGSNNPPQYIESLREIYCWQLNRIIKNKRLAKESDFIDFEWRAYIASPDISYFITDNTRDFQKVFPKGHFLSAKLKSFSELF